jgi:hypothetical protein
MPHAIEGSKMLQRAEAALIAHNAEQGISAE